MKDKINYRKAAGIIQAANIEERQKHGGPMMLQGYAAIFNSPTDLGRFDEVISATAFENADVSDVRFMVDHAGIPLGRTSAGTMTLRTDSKGLQYTVTLPETARAAEVFEAIRRGDLTQSSFAFTIAAEEWQEENGRQVRYIKEVAVMLDASCVTFPAYPDTTVEALSLGM